MPKPPLRFRASFKCWIRFRAFVAILFLFPPAAVAASDSVIPAWVPVYPGSKVTVSRTQQAGTESYLWFTVLTRDVCGRVWRFYDEKLKLAGFSVVLSTRSGDEDCVHVMRAHTAGGEREVNLSGGPRITYSAGNPVRNTEYEVEVVQRGGSGTRQKEEAANGSIPTWLPAYPGWVPQGISAKRDGAETFISFRFTSRDDAKRILSWFQEKLRQMGFNVSMDVFGTNGALRSNTRDQSRAVKIEVSAAGAQNVVLMEIQDGQ